MALKPLNSAAGFSVGETPSNVISGNGDISANNFSTIGVANLNVIGNIRISGGTTGQVIQTDGNGNLSFTTISTTSLVNGNSNVQVLANANITFSSAGNANVVVITGTGANVDGYVSANYFVGSGNGLSNIQAANVTGQIANALVAGTVYTNAQPNITSVGTLTSLAVTGNVTGNNFSTTGTGGDVTLTGGNVTGANVVIANSFTSNGGLINFSTNNPNVQLGNVANVHIGGGTSGQVIQTDGNGNLSFTTIGTSGISNGTSGVAVPIVNGNIDLTSAGNTTMVVTATGANVTGYLTVSGNAQFTNANLGNLATANYANLTNDLVVQGNIANANNISVTNNITSNTANVTGNLTSGNANLGNLATANYANLTNDLVVQGNIANANNISVTNIITANVANITTVVNTGEIANGTSNIRLATNGNVTISSNNTSNVFTFSNLGANVVGYIQANGIISVGGFSGSNLVSNVGILSLQATQAGGNYNINLLAGGNGNIDVGTTYITSVKDPLNAQDAATKAYVDSVAQGLDIKASVQFATAAVLPAYTYNNGASGVGATITANANGALTIDGGSPAAASRVLIKNETGDISGANSAYNGIYVVTDAGSAGTPFILIRATDFDNGNPSGEMPGGFVFVEQGTINADTGWVCTTNNPITVGTTPIAFAQFSAAGAYTANNSAGLVLIGSEFNAKVDGITTDFSGGNIVVKASANLTTPNIGAATGTSLAVSGNVLAGNLNSNASISAIDGNLTGNLTVSSNISGANVIFANSFTSNGGLINFSTNNPNVQLGNVANVHVLGGTSGQVIQTDGNGNLSFTTIGTSGISNGTSSVSVPTVNGNINLVSASNTTMVVTATGANVTGYLTVSGNAQFTNANLGNLATANFVNISSNTTTNNLTVNLELAGNTANFTGNITSLNANLGNLVTANFANIASNTITNNLTVNLALAGNTANFSGNIVALNTNAGNLLTANFANIASNTTTSNLTVNLELSGNTANFTGNITSLNANLGNLATANIVTVNNNLNVGPLTQIAYGNVTTAAITANQTIASLSATGVTGVEFLVKGIDAAGSKYSMATVQAVTDGANVEYSVFGTVQLGGFTGSLAVNIAGSNVALQVTPASSNSTVWVTQVRTI